MEIIVATKLLQQSVCYSRNLNIHGGVHTLLDFCHKSEANKINNCLYCMKPYKIKGLKCAIYSIKCASVLY